MGAIPPALLAGSWHRCREIFQLFQKGVFLPQLGFIYDSAEGAAVGRNRRCDLSLPSEDPSQGEMPEIIPVIPAGAEAGKGKTWPQHTDPPEQLLLFRAGWIS